MAQYNAWYVILWRLLVFVPMQFFRLGFIVCVLISFGTETAKWAWKATALAERGR